jgi:uncharacterized protein
MRQSILAVCSAVVLASYPAVAQIREQRSSASHADPDSAKSNLRAPQGAAIAARQVRHAMRGKVNEGLVGIVSGSVDATDLGKATDLAIGLDAARDHLRPLLIVGKGAFQNVTDIVFARGIDVGIIQSDVLAALKRDPPFPGIENYLQYITKLYDEEVHVLAGKDIDSIAALMSKKVNFGIPDSGTHMTADAIFRTLGISVEATSFPQPIALETETGEISALVCLVSKPDRWLLNIGPEENFHFLSIPPSDEPRASYTSANLTAEDYPGLIAADKPVSTVAVGSILN